MGVCSHTVSRLSRPKGKVGDLIRLLPSLLPPTIIVVRVFCSRPTTPRSGFRENIRSILIHQLMASDFTSLVNICLHGSAPHVSEGSGICLLEHHHNVLYVYALKLHAFRFPSEPVLLVAPCNKRHTLALDSYPCWHPYQSYFQLPLRPPNGEPSLS